MRTKGYFGIGCLNMKTSHNYGSLFRTAQIFDADFIFLIGQKFKHQATDTMCSYRHMPLYVYSDIEHFMNSRPFSCPIVAIEMKENSIPLHKFSHPKQCIYLLGSEDNGLPNTAIDICQATISLPGDRSLNVAVAGSIVLYDRVAKNNSINN